MSKKSPTVSDKARDFFQNLFRIRLQSSQDSTDQTPPVQTMIHTETPIVPIEATRSIPPQNGEELQQEHPLERPVNQMSVEVMALSLAQGNAKTPEVADSSSALREERGKQIVEEKILPVSESKNEASDGSSLPKEPHDTKSLQEAAKPLISTLNHTSSFRADDILRAKLESTDSTTVLSKIPPSPIPVSKEPTTHGVKPPPLPNIRPPAFSPLVSLKHIEPFEHSEKPKFRPRQSSAPPPKSTGTPSQSSPPAVVTTVNGTSKKPSSSYNRRSEILPDAYPSPNYIWDSWEQPAFNRAPGCLPLSADHPSLPRQSRNLSNGPPPPVYYYDAYTGQYVPSHDFRNFSRYSGSLGRRSKSRKHNHHHHNSEDKSMGRYGTSRRNQSTSCLSPCESEAPQSMAELGYTMHRPPVLVQMRAQTPVMPYKPQLSSRVLQNYRNEDEVFYQQRKQPQPLLQLPPLPQQPQPQLQHQQQLVSRGTDDTPIYPATSTVVRQQPLMAANGPSVYGNVNTVSTAPYPEVITPVYVPPSVIVSHLEQKEELSGQEGDRGEPIRYTSDVVRSLNRQAFKMGRRNSKEGALSPKEHYLEVISNGSSSQRSNQNRSRVEGFRVNGTSERPKVRDLVRRFSSQGEEGFVGEQYWSNSRSPRPDVHEGGYGDAYGHWRGGTMRR